MAKPTTNYLAPTKSTTIYSSTSKSSTNFSAPAKNTTDYSVNSALSAGVKLNSSTVTLGSLSVRMHGFTSVMPPNFLRDVNTTSFTGINKSTTNFASV